MKTRCLERGSVLLVTLMIASMFGMFLMSYLYVVQQQRKLVTRSQAWNSALAAAEAGVEEALAQLNPGAPLPTIDRTANGWGASVGGLYGPVSRHMSGGGYSVVYTADTFPVIYATGYVTVPTLSARLARTLRIGTTNAPLFTAGIAARGNLNVNGNNVATDSFDSTDPNLSNDGRYDPTRTSTNGDIASFGGIVNVGNGDINGSVLLGASATGNVLANGTVTGGISDDFNFDFGDVILPDTSWLPPILTNAVIDGQTYDYVLTGTGDYVIDRLAGSLYVAPYANIRLKLTGDASPACIRVAGPSEDAGKLTIYMDGPSFTVSGGQYVDGGSALGLAYYGTTANTRISFTGNASFTGTIYAPSAEIRLGGGGNNTYDFVGAIVGRLVTLNGHFNFHYDEALLTLGPMRGYTASSWSEMAWAEL